MMLTEDSIFKALPKQVIVMTFFFCTKANMSQDLKESALLQNQAL